MEKRPNELRKIPLAIAQALKTAVENQSPRDALIYVSGVQAAFTDNVVGDMDKNYRQRIEPEGPEFGIYLQGYLEMLRHIDKLS